MYEDDAAVKKRKRARAARRREFVRYRLLKLAVTLGIIFLVWYMVYIAIWYPVSQTARQASCLGNIRKVGMGALIYADDWNGRLPVGRLTRGRRAVAWFSVLLPDVESGVAALSCPSRIGERGYGFGLNYSASGRDLGQNSPGWKVMFADATRVTESNWWVNDDRCLDLGRRNRPPRGCHRNGTANFFFLDGHAGTVSPRELTEPNWIFGGP